VTGATTVVGDAGASIGAVEGLRVRLPDWARRNSGGTRQKNADQEEDQKPRNCCLM